GGMAITYTGTSLPHGLSYPVTYELGVPHGKAVGMFLGGYVAMYEDKQAVMEVMTLLGFDDTALFCRYLRELLGNVEVSQELLVKDAKSILENPAKLKNYPFTIDEQGLIEMANYI
ncbi:MAG: iron-containing alcohol dehydrogenase, partial [Lachnospiraceae bacterium]|nr:iron-containing alcohol dehydrogenase [Lachnospiraceae bacterium]